MKTFSIYELKFAWQEDFFIVDFKSRLTSHIKQNRLTYSQKLYDSIILHSPTFSYKLETAFHEPIAYNRGKKNFPHFAG